MAGPEPLDQYREMDYFQFTMGPRARLVMSVVGVLFWPLVLPCAVLSKLSAVLFRTFSEMLAQVPYFPGVIVRYEFYRFALAGCGKNVVIESGSIFTESSASLGSNVLIGRYCIVHDCQIGNDVLIGERCTFLAGSKQHSFARADVPMSQQGGSKKRIGIGNDCWIGSHSLIADDVGTGSVVAGGSVVLKPIPARAIAAGVPAEVKRYR